MDLDKYVIENRYKRMEKELGQWKKIALLATKILRILMGRMRGPSFNTTINPWAYTELSQQLDELDK